MPKNGTVIYKNMSMRSNTLKKKTKCPVPSFRCKFKRRIMGASAQKYMICDYL